MIWLYLRILFISKMLSTHQYIFAFYVSVFNINRWINIICWYVKFFSLFDSIDLVYYLIVFIHLVYVISYCCILPWVKFSNSSKSINFLSQNRQTDLFQEDFNDVVTKYSVASITKSTSCNSCNQLFLWVYVIYFNFLI